MICKFDDLGKSNLIPGCIYEGGDTKTPLKDDPLSKLFKIDGYKKGIGNIGGFRKASKEENGKIINENIAFVVMVDSGKQEEWPNEMDENTGIFKYYGDNRTPGNDIFKTKKLGREYLGILNDLLVNSNLCEKASLRKKEIKDESSLVRKVMSKFRKEN